MKYFVTRILLFPYDNLKYLINTYILKTFCFLLTFENPIFGVGAWCIAMSCLLSTENMKKKKHIVSLFAKTHTKTYALDISYVIAGTSTNYVI